MNGEPYSSRGRDSGRPREYQGSRQDRERGDRGERGDREDRRDRDRDRRDRGDRGDRGDRADRGDRGERDRERGERRRSRSPHHRPRRDYEDSYSSSRDYRAREREDRYTNTNANTNRRDDREWNRDRGPRRRDDDRRQNRDLFDDRRRGGGGGGRDRGERGDRDPGAREDRDEFAAQARGQRANSPPKKREPTPDLTDVVSVLSRKRRMTQWDIKPPGYDHVTAEQAKLSGMFPLPGAPRQQMDPSRLQAFINQPQGGADSAALKPSNARQSKRLFLYNIPASATEESIMSFFNLQLNGLNVIHGNDPCISANISTERDFALLEFKTPSDATVALALDGITMEEHHTEANGSANGNVKGLEIKRPKDYIVPLAESEGQADGQISSDVPDTENKICITHVPSALDDQQMQELLQAFGELKAFVMVRDQGTGESRGIAFCEYVSSEATPIAIEGLGSVEFGDVTLKASLASIGYKQAVGLETGVNAMSMFAGTTSDDFEETRVLQLLNMVTPEELIDNDEYEEICEDVSEECSKYGQIVELKIPRPAGGSRQSAGVGKIYIKYINVESAKKALQSLAGRKFADRTVVTSYFDESSFDVSAW